MTFFVKVHIQYTVQWLYNNATVSSLSFQMCMDGTFLNAKRFLAPTAEYTFLKTASKLFTSKLAFVPTQNETRKRSGY